MNYKFLENTFTVITIAILGSCQAANVTSIGITTDLLSSTMMPSNSAVATSIIELGQSYTSVFTSSSLSHLNTSAINSGFSSTVSSTSTAVGESNTTSSVTSNESTNSTVMLGTPTTSLPANSIPAAATSTPTSSPSSLEATTGLSTPVASTPTPSQSQTSKTAQPSTSVSPNTGATFKGCGANQNSCKNDGKCYIGTDNSMLCVCTGDYYGSKCEKEANPLFKPLVYAFGGATGFLLLVICIALIISCKKAKGYDTNSSKDLDGFNNIGLRAKGAINDSLIIE
ncbi:uncharacterized protein LOC135684949 isoform X1 [Rhopilema esculentum]|uniref:uncharacterized protein LOC135684949 isoform X1 n=1 Tax=Rhopilema esculentum TaxID=499914 RepID=UPI0031DAE7F2